MNISKINLDFFNKASAALKNEPLFENKYPILLAVSGGKDSMALLYYFAKKRKNIIAAHFNHAIRGKESDADEKLVKKYCFDNSVPFVSAKADIPLLSKKRKETLEHTARKERYVFLEKAARKYGCKIICTAHHADDNSETFLLNLLRGKDLKGLSGIPKKRILSEDICVFRPFLDISRKEIEVFVKVNKIPYSEDKTNKDEKYFRNWIRNTLIPLLETKQPKIKEHINFYCSQIASFYKQNQNNIK
ncbi:MAG: tRNA lysidine(34) synthetase TilS [Elusimicrobiota bacterium]